jgi:hypothetical protein
MGQRCASNAAAPSERENPKKCKREAKINRNGPKGEDKGGGHIKKTQRESV